MTEHKYSSKKAGLPPGTLIHIGKKSSKEVKISVMDYTDTHFFESDDVAIEETFSLKETPGISWINVDGIHNTDIIQSFGTHFDFHPLLLEDIMNTLHRPKLEEFQDYLFLTLKMLGIDKKGESIIIEQISFILGKNYLISFQEQAGDVFEPIRIRLREAKGNIRNRGADYLFYRLIDAVVDQYFFITDHLSERIDNLEELVLTTQTTAVLHQIQESKKQLILLRKSLSPLREAITLLQKNEAKLIQKNTLRYFNDVYEHIIQVNESIEMYREMTQNLTDLYQSGINNKMNQIMQVLTIIATIFIPLTFIVGIYGMNFDYMPELRWKYGYFFTWGIMVLVVLVMLIYFRRKKWF
ncbi:MAG: magnesium/cobalt transporter CorA [Flavobacteriaceae bacterium]|nr:magnesium/cobalt transporter CorA [Flavobacteriaceae bacterium]